MVHQLMSHLWIVKFTHVHSIIDHKLLNRLYWYCWKWKKFSRHCCCLWWYESPEPLISLREVCKTPLGSPEACCWVSSPSSQSKPWAVTARHQAGRSHPGWPWVSTTSPYIWGNLSFCIIPVQKAEHSAWARRISAQLLHNSPEAREDSPSAPSLLPVPHPAPSSLPLSPSASCIERAAQFFEGYENLCMRVYLAVSVVVCVCGWWWGVNVIEPKSTTDDCLRKHIA